MLVDEIIEKITNAHKIGICGHINPDGDSIGSCLALANTLDRLGKIPYVYLDESAIKFDSAPGRNFISNKTDIDLFISLDTANFERISHHKELFNEVDNIVIDHHISNIGYGKLNFIEESASSTCEVLHFIISKLLKIDVNIAAWLYTGMMTDTDNFSYSNTTPKTLRIAADLIETGIDSSRINFSWLKARSLEKFRMLATLRDHIIYTPDIGLIHMTISYDHMKSNNVKETDLNTISTSLNVIEEAAIVIFLREGEKGLTKASFRSKKVDVNQIAAHFGGGGHKLAAGCSFKASPEEAIEQIINYLRKIEVWKSF